uniref:Uncharacterized protein n=1 Tax=Knipowitschia caucasica TaxID=637954 RepID=A0AAV2L9S6_KNICA
MARCQVPFTDGTPHPPHRHGDRVIGDVGEGFGGAACINSRRVRREGKGYVGDVTVGEQTLHVVCAHRGPGEAREERVCPNVHPDLPLSEHLASPTSPPTCLNPLRCRTPVRGRVTCSTTAEVCRLGGRRSGGQGSTGAEVLARGGRGGEGSPSARLQDPVFTTAARAKFKGRLGHQARLRGQARGGWQGTKGEQEDGQIIHTISHNRAAPAPPRQSHPHCTPPRLAPPWDLLASLALASRSNPSGTRQCVERENTCHPRENETSWQ